MNNFVQPGPGENMLYICIKCKNRFSHKVPVSVFGIILKSVKCPVCGGKAVKDPSVQY